MSQHRLLRGWRQAPRRSVVQYVRFRSPLPPVPVPFAEALLLVLMTGGAPNPFPNDWPFRRRRDRPAPRRRPRPWRPVLAWVRSQTFSQNAQFTSTVVASTAVTLGASVAVGDVVCLVTTAGGTDISNRTSGGNCWPEPGTVKDQLGNVWLGLSYEQGGVQFDFGNSQNCGFWWCIIGFAGTPTITYAPGTSRAWQAIKGSHFTGGDANSFRRLTTGQQQINPGGQNNAIVTAPVNALAGDLVWVGSGDPGSATATQVAGTGFTASTVDATSGLIDEWQSATGPTVPSFTDVTNGAARTYMTAAIVITPSGAGTGTGDSSGTPQLIQLTSIPNTNGVPVDGMPGMLFRLPEPSGGGVGGPGGGSGNCLFLLFRYVKNAATPTVTDDQGNLGWVQAVADTDNTNNVQIAAWVCPSARQNTREIFLLFTGGTPTKFSGAAGEVYNAALSSVVDGSNHTSTGAGAAATAWDALSFTPTNSNGMVLYYGVCQDPAATPAVPYTSTTVTLQTVDGIDGQVVGTTNQSGHPAINASVTSQSAVKYSALAFCLKTAAAGMAPAAAGLRVRSILHSRIPVNNTSTVLQIPALANSCLVLGGGGTYSPNTGITSIADSNTNTWGLAVGNVNLFASQLWYAPQIVASQGMTVTITTPTVSGAEVAIWELVNAAAHPLEAVGVAQATQSVVADLVSATIWPLGPGRIVISAGDQNRGTILGLMGRDTFFFDVPRWPRTTVANTGQDEESGTGGAGNSFTLDSHRGHYYTVDNSPVTFVQVNTGGNGLGLQEWNTVAACFAPLLLPKTRQAVASVRGD